MEELQEQNVRLCSPSNHLHGAAAHGASAGTCLPTGCKQAVAWRMKVSRMMHAACLRQQHKRGATLTV